MSAIVDLPAHVQALIDRRQRHEEALSGINQTLAAIDQTMAEIAAAFGTPAPRKVSRPPGTASATPVPAARSKRRRTRRTYAISGDESVLAFIRQRKGATSSEIRAHWSSADRRGTPDNALSKLFKAKKVERKPLGKGMRGSQYSVA